MQKKSKDDRIFAKKYTPVFSLQFTWLKRKKSLFSSIRKTTVVLSQGNH